MSEILVGYEVSDDPRRAGRAVSAPGVQKMQPRWYVPGRVMPIVYGAAAPEDQYIWVDAQGNHAGPFPARAYPQ